jgi:hypothetical protein
VGCRSRWALMQGMAALVVVLAMPAIAGAQGIGDPPTVEIVSGPPPETESREATLVFEATGAIESIRCELRNPFGGSQLNQNCNSGTPETYTGLEVGNYSYVVEVCDSQARCVRDNWDWRIIPPPRPVPSVPSQPTCAYRDTPIRQQELP